MQFRGDKMCIAINTREFEIKKKRDPGDHDFWIQFSIHIFWFQTAKKLDSEWRLYMHGLVIILHYNSALLLSDCIGKRVWFWKFGFKCFVDEFSLRYYQITLISRKSVIKKIIFEV